jgi:HPt (histidine-containing phosphotransfer) domain-containing protein
MRGDQERFIAAGMDDVIFKPVDIAKLKLILEKYIKESDSRPAVPGQILGKHAPLIHPEEYDLAGTAAAIAISEEDLNSIVLEFFDHLAPSYLQDLEAAIQTGDKAAIRIAAHKLRGTTANLRFGPCVDELAFIENAAAGLECIDYHHRFLHLRLMLQNLERTIRGSVSHPLPDGPEDGVPRSFDPGKGLAFLGGDHDLYTVLLGTFVSRYALVEEELTCALGQGRYEEARRIIHGLKGAAANLGLSAVESGARVLEVRLAGGGQAAIGDSEVRSLLDAVKRILVEAPGIKP